MIKIKLLDRQYLVNNDGEVYATVLPDLNILMSKINEIITVVNSEKKKL